MSQGGKGDFVAAIHRGLGQESYLADVLKTHLMDQGYKQESFTFSKLATEHHFIENIGEFKVRVHKGMSFIILLTISNIFSSDGSQEVNLCGWVCVSATFK